MIHNVINAKKENLSPRQILVKWVCFAILSLRRQILLHYYILTLQTRQGDDLNLLKIFLFFYATKLTFRESQLRRLYVLYKIHYLFTSIISFLHFFCTFPSIPCRIMGVIRYFSSTAP